MNNLSEVVKMQGLAPDAKPAKPEELTAWETKKGNTSLPAKPQAPSLCVQQQQARLPRQQLGVAPHFLGYPCRLPRQQAVRRHRSQPQGGWLDSAPLS